MSDPDFYDATTIFPDHVVARIIAIAALASLIGREKPEPVRMFISRKLRPLSNQLAASYVTDAARTAEQPVGDDTAVHGVYPCAGEDEWCVISLRTASDRRPWPTPWAHRNCPKTVALSSKRCRRGRRGWIRTPSQSCFNGRACRPRR